jgi:hypothetical protein
MPMSTPDCARAGSGTIASATANISIPVCRRRIVTPPRSVALSRQDDFRGGTGLTSGEIAG